VTKGVTRRGGRRDTIRLTDPRREVPIRAFATLTLALALAFGLASSQEAPQTIELNMVNVHQYRVTDVRWAGDEPFSGETSTFDGRDRLRPRGRGARS